MTNGCFKMASPWNANSSTNVNSKAAIDHGPILSMAASKADCPLRINDLRTRYAYDDIIDVVKGAGEHLDTIMIPKAMVVTIAPKSSSNSAVFWIQAASCRATACAIT